MPSGIGVVLDSVPDGCVDPVDSLVALDPLVVARARDVPACVVAVFDGVVVGVSSGAEDLLSVSPSQAVTTATARRTGVAAARRTVGNLRMDAAFRR
ncbi:MAG TPA: hypothetical protein VJM33_07825 [Microthrixaceae bacterium]|nr:hypothetical protein [Microthrixaceae bacterium]